MKKIITGLLFLIFSTSAYADDGNFKGLFSIGLNAGSEDLASFSDGTSLTSAGLFSFSGGVTYKIGSTGFDIQTAFGYAFDSVEAVQGTFKFSKTSIEIIPFYRVTDRTRIGFGLYNVISAKYTDPVGSIGYGFSTGTILEINWQLTKRASWGIRYIDLDLSADTLDGVDISSLGLSTDGGYIGFQYYGHF